MKGILFVIIFLLISGCAVSQRYYIKSNLNSISIGQTKQEILEKFPGEGFQGGAPPMQIRAAQVRGGKLIEVGEVYLIDNVSPPVAYWFLFENGKLIQWGQPVDWKDVKERYEINYNPPVGVSY